jgi:hypothetical protein
MSKKGNTLATVINEAVAADFISALKNILKEKEGLDVVRMVEQADNVLLTFSNKYKVSQFKRFWEKYHRKYSELQQRVTLYYFLVHATQHYDFRRLMHCYDEIRECLNCDLNPKIVQIIEKHTVCLPKDANVHDLKGWLGMRKDAMGQYEILKKYIFDECFLLSLPDEANRDYLRNFYTNGKRTPNGYENIFTLIRTKDGEPLLGLKAILCETSRVIYLLYLTKEYTMTQMMDIIGVLFGVDLSRYSQIHQDSQTTLWVRELVKNAEKNVNSGIKMFLCIIIYTLSIP